MYDQFYGLTGRPFQLTPDPQFYFESATHRKALSYLGYGLAQGEGFIVITGEVGAGKSTLVGHLMQTIDKARLTARTIVTSQLAALDLVQMAAESFGIQTRGLDKAATLKSIEDFLFVEARAGRRCLLIVDEAQNLSIDALEELRMLSNFQLGSSALLQIFLLGQPEFRHLLTDSPELEQLRQRVIATHHLEAMEAGEVKPYVEHRLTCAGWNGRPQLTDGAYDILYAETDGVPRKLNTVMNRAMLMGAVEQVESIDGELVKAVIADMAGKPFEYEAPLSARAETETAPVATTEADIGEQKPAPDVADVIVAAEPDTEIEAIPTSSPDEPVVSPVAVVDNTAVEELTQRIAALEARVAEQDAALRRVLAMLINWMDKEASVQGQYGQSRAA